MRYNAFFGELPVNAFKPRPGGGMTLEGGGNPLDAVSNAIGDVASGVGNVVGGAVDFVSEHPLESALLAAGVYYAPEIGAFVNENGAVLTPTEAGFTGELPAGYAGYTPPTVTNLGTVAGDTTGMTSGTALSDVGVENAYTAAQDAQDALAMTGNPAANATLTGVEGIGAQNAYPALNAAAAGAAAAAGMTPAQIAAAAAAGTGLSSGIGNSLSDVLTAGAIGSGISGIAGAGAAKDAAQMQADAANKAAAQQQSNFELINKQQAPYRAAGYGALSNLGALGTGTYQMYDANGNPTGTGTGSGYLQHQFDASDLAKGLAPNYDFMLQQGQMANQRAANAAGGGFGGNALTGLQRYTQDYAGNAYQNAFNNYQTQRNNIYNTLAGIAGIGQTGQNATNTAATNATNAATQLGVGSAAAQAAGTIGQTGAYTGAINNALNNYTLASLLNQGGRVG